MANMLDNVTNILVLGGIGLLTYFAYTGGWFKGLFPSSAGGSESCDAYSGLPFYLCKLGEFTVGGQGSGGDPVTPAVDDHGCRTDIQRWCEVENKCLDNALTCESQVFVDPKPWLSCLPGQDYESAVGCYYPVISDAPNISIVPTRCPDKVGGFLSLGSNPSVDCDQALAVMCTRFGGDDARYC
jgi:hypothetical protein